MQKTEERTTREKHAFRVDRQRVDDGVVSTKVENKCSLRAFPFFNVIAACRT